MGTITLTTTSPSGGGGVSSVLTGDVLWVDAVNGNDATAISGRLDKPYLTITAALAAAVSGDLVYVLPGTYDETSLVIPDDVTLAGVDRVRCKITHSVISNTTIVTMGANTSLENLSIEGGSLAFPAGGRTLVNFPATTSSTSVARNLLLTGNAGSVAGVAVSGTGVSTNNWVTIDHVDIKGSGVSNGLLCNSTGFFVVRDCVTYGLVGCTVNAGAVEFQDCKITGLTGLSIVLGATAYVNQSTRWNSLTNAGTLASSGLYLHPNAGGDLSGVMPDPIVAAITETSGPTQLVIGAVADGEHLARSGGTLVGVSTPPLHAASHESGGGDEISVAGLAGLLADAQTPLAHASTHLSTGSDPIDEFVGATGASDGLDGLVKKPVAGEEILFLRGDGTWSAATAGTAYADFYNSAAYTGITTTASTLPLNTTRQSDPAFALASNEITINTGGTYRIDLDLSLDESSTSDTTVDMWLELNGSEVAGTRARMFHDNNMEEGGNHSMCILTVAASDLLRMRAQVVSGSSQTDTLANGTRFLIHTVGADGAPGPQGPPGAGSTIIVEDEGATVTGGPHSTLDFVGSGVTATDAGGGVCTVTIPAGSANIAQYVKGNNLTIAVLPTTVSLNVTDFEDSAYTRAGSDITINRIGVYRISYSVYFDTNANARRTCDAWVENNTVEIVPSRSSSYARNNTDDTANSTASFFVELAAGDVVRLRAQSTGTGGTAIGQGDRMWISIEHMRAP